MSKGNMVEIMVRVKGAEPESPIAIFRTPQLTMLNAVFANTVVTQQMIADKDMSFVGVYHNGMDLKDVERELSGKIVG